MLHSPDVMGAVRDLRWNLSKDQERQLRALPASKQLRAASRLFAKIIDYTLFGSAAVVGAICAASLLGGGETAFLFALIIAWLSLPLLEAVTIYIFGSSPGKFHFHLQLAEASKAEEVETQIKPKLNSILRRSYKSWLFGMAAGLPIVNLFTMYAAKRQLERLGVTSWDREESFHVVPEAMSSWREILKIVSVIFSFAVIVISGVTTLGTNLASSFAAAAADERILGEKYLNGDGVVKDEARAAELFMKAAEGNDSQAQFFLGLLYHEGRGVKKDHVESLKWMEVAIPHSSGLELEYATALREFLLKNLSPAEIGVAKDQVDKWHREHKF